jgi:hypothetical protein
VAIEHILAGVKRVRIVKERFRNTKANFADRVMLIACGLHNLRQSVRHPLLPPLRPEHAISNNVYYSGKKKRTPTKTSSSPTLASEKCTS